MRGNRMGGRGCAKVSRLSLLPWCLPATHAADTLGFLTRVCRKGGGSCGKGAGGVTGAAIIIIFPEEMVIGPIGAQTPISQPLSGDQE